MNQEYAKAFGEAANQVFSTMLDAPVTVSPFKLTDPATLSLHVSGIIGMSGDVVGVAALTMSLESARSVVARFAGGDPSPNENHEDFADAIGELINMITGGAKAKLVGRSVSISCPSVVIGRDHKLFQRKNKPVLEIPCHCQCGDFCLLIWTTDCPNVPRPCAAAATTAGV